MHIRKKKKAKRCSKNAIKITGLKLTREPQVKLAKITTKQEEILKLLYSYRFLNRIQIQTLMNHKDKRRVGAWLKDLREKQYISWIYSTDFLEKTKPAIYYLGINGIRHLTTLERELTDPETNETQIVPAYPITELRKRYREKERSPGFIARSILVADACVTLMQKTSQNTQYDLYIEADYIDKTSDYHFLAEDEYLRPNLCIVKWQHASNQHDENEGSRTNYLLEIFDSTLPRYRLKARLKYYTNYLINDDWGSGDNNPSPILLLVIPTLADLIYAKRRVKRLLLNEFYDTEDIPEDLHIRFTRTEQLQKGQIKAKIWEEERKLYDV